MAVISAIVAQRAAELEDDGVCGSRPDVTSRRGSGGGGGVVWYRWRCGHHSVMGSMFLTEVVHLKLCPFQSPNTRLTVVFPVLSLQAGLVFLTLLCSNTSQVMTLTD